MLPRALVALFCVWVLVPVFVLEAAADEKDDLALCDDEYRSKYIVAKTLFQDLKNTKHSGNVKHVQESKHNWVQEDGDDEDNDDDDDDENSKEETKDGAKATADKNKGKGSKGSDEDSKEDDEDCKRKCDHKAHGARRSMGGRRSMGAKHPPLDGMLSPKPSSTKSPFSIFIKTEIGINLADEELQVHRGRRRKRETDPWEGETSCRPGRRVIGGTVAKDIEQLPYMVFVDSGCGGSLISDRWVLTASHCINGPNDPKYVYAGSLKLTGGCRHKVEKIIKHPKFEAKKYIYDLALLKLYEPFIFSPAIKPISLSVTSPTPGDCGTVSGWGTTVLNGTLVYDLKITALPVVQSKRCRMFRNLGEGQFCAGFRDAQTDTCQGDSGGPFVVHDILVGIVSYGFKCAVPETPGVYVDVAAHREWIDSIAGI